jgi:hypothetical protein
MWLEHACFVENRDLQTEQAKGVSTVRVLVMVSILTLVLVLVVVLLLLVVVVVVFFELCIYVNTNSFAPFKRDSSGSHESFS